MHLLQQPLPDSLLRDLLAESYPQLLEHAHNVYDYAFNPALPAPPAMPHYTGFSLWSILPGFPVFWRRGPDRVEDDTTEGAKEVKTIQRRFATLRWGFFALALVTFGAFIGLSDMRRSLTIVANERRNTQLLLQRMEKQQKKAEEGGEEDEEAGDEYEDEDDEE